MNILLLLIPLSLMLLAVAIGAFVWAVRRGQFDDLDAAAIDILVDDAIGESRARARNAGHADAD